MASLYFMLVEKTLNHQIIPNGLKIASIKHAVQMVQKKAQFDDRIRNLLALAEDNSEESRTLFKILCQEEAKHKLALEIMYDDYMAEMGD